MVVLIINEELSVKQEDINSMMRYPWESDYRDIPEALPLCPACWEAYCGDGVEPCIECKETEN
ncbi:hypothetical protein NVP1060A_08 [Vibrio phage 1.060.A._10N.261.48.B5]|nr:hypothetical protein NVP1060A_08 [Vibrio phage 1.060.A._10N.261.48.B5]